MSYQAIADELGFRDRSGSWRAVRRCLGRRQAEAADQYLVTLLVDLEAVGDRAWARAMAGDLRASAVVLRAVEDRLRLAEFLSTSSTRQSTSALEKRVSKPGRAGKDRGAEPGHFTTLEC
jgi:hypothetical protein